MKISKKYPFLYKRFQEKHQISTIKYKIDYSFSFGEYKKSYQLKICFYPIAKFHCYYVLKFDSEREVKNFIKYLIDNHLGLMKTTTFSLKEAVW